MIRVWGCQSAWSRTFLEFAPLTWIPVSIQAHRATVSMGRLIGARSLLRMREPRTDYGRRHSRRHMHVWNREVSYRLDYGFRPVRLLA